MIQYLAIIIIFTLGISLVPTSALALTGDERYASGYGHGCSDGRKGSQVYLRNSGGAVSHTAIFMNGYRDGYRDCNAGTENWANLCQQIQWGLVKDCSVYVTPANTPTTEGVRAKNCITNGAFLSAVGLYLTKDPIKVIGILQPASELLGCGNIVNWNLLQVSAIGQVRDFLTVLGINL